MTLLYSANVLYKKNEKTNCWFKCIVDKLKMTGQFPPMTSEENLILLYDIYDNTIAQHIFINEYLYRDFTTIPEIINLIYKYQYDLMTPIRNELAQHPLILVY